MGEDLSSSPCHINPSELLRADLRVAMLFLDVSVECQRHVSMLNVRKIAPFSMSRHRCLGMTLARARHVHKVATNSLTLTHRRSAGLGCT